MAQLRLEVFLVRYILWRILGVIGVLLAISLITFVLMHSIPGGPWDELKMSLSGVQLENMLDHAVTNRTYISLS